MADSGNVPGSDSDSDIPAPSDETNSAGATEGEQSDPTVAEPTRLFDPLEHADQASGWGDMPQRLGKYTIEERIGQGGMGVVWKGFDTDLHRTVAIKMLGGHLAHSPTSRRRFQREARAAAAISHANVLTIYSVEEHEGVPFLVMEYINGQSLKEYVASKEKLDPVEVIQLGCQIAQGLAAAHAQGVIHRDVKPGNVMLHEGGTCAQLTDFGLARAAFDNIDLTSHDQCVGTPTYMSPESLRGEKVDARSDLFSLGCVLYSMLSGYSPFQGRTPGEAVHKILDSTQTPLHELNPAVPPVLSDLVDRLLQKMRGDRYQSAAEVADHLAHLQRQVNQAPTDEIDGLLASASIPTETPDVSRSRTTWLVVATACCVLVAIVLWRLQPEPNDGTSGTGAVPPGEAAPVVVEKLSLITVGAGPEADFETIAEAVRHADKNATITVTGSEPYVESVTIEGAEMNGLRLLASPRVIWRSSPVGGNRALVIKDVDDITVEGFDFAIDDAAGRAVHIIGDARNIVIDDCEFQHVLEKHDLSLLLVASAPADDVSTVAIRNCRFSPAEGSVMGLVVGDAGSAPRVECSHCIFQGPNVLVFVTELCHQLTMRHNVFIGGNNAINLSLKSWHPDSRFEVVNNTFVGTRYWLGLMDSFRSESLPTGLTDSRVCNNLILGGVRMQGGDDQWGVALGTWTFSANWWERDSTTQADAGRNGHVARLQDRLDIPEREDVDSVDYLVPAANSSLLTSGAAGDLPVYIGARTRTTAEE